VTLDRYDEDRIVGHLLRDFEHGNSVHVGPGDDCAVVGLKSDTQWQLLKADVIVEDVHFVRDSPPRRIGWKAMARPLSDIAAMGGLPQFALVTIAVKSDTTLRFLETVYGGIADAAKRFNVDIVGGETSRSPGPLFINIALTGRVTARECALRSGGEPGDWLYVTGALGGSIRGKHLRFIPRIEEARWLTANFTIKAMIDLSDGLGADLPRLARASGAGFVLDRDRVPRTRGCTLDHAISDGEDYELLFAVSPQDGSQLERRWAKKFPKLPLTHIGELTARGESARLHGYDHFAKRR
jgi:thiamine-monophosphate kinase